MGACEGPSEQVMNMNMDMNSICLNAFVCFCVRYRECIMFIVCTCVSSGDAGEFNIGVCVRDSTLNISARNFGLETFSIGHSLE